MLLDISVREGENEVESKSRDPVTQWRTVVSEKNRISEINDS